MRVGWDEAATACAFRCSERAAPKHESHYPNQRGILAEMTAVDPTHFDSGLARERDRVVRAHIDAEERGDWGAALETFRHPRYEVVPTNEVHDGADAVHDFYQESARA